jgi:hypothetical protein
MSGGMLWVVLTVVVSVFVVAVAIWQERRAARRCGSLRCPGCGSEFRMSAYTTWHKHTRLAWRCRWESGPYLRCKEYGVGFRYTQSGELHPEQFAEEAARRL